MHQRYKDRVKFLAVYLREAHASDVWSLKSNEKVGINFKQPRVKSERLELARHCCKKLEITMPMAVDDMDDTVGHLYSGMPDRLYLIDPAGKVAYKGGRGPRHYIPEELEQSIIQLLLDQDAAAKGR